MRFQLAYRRLAEHSERHRPPSCYLTTGCISRWDPCTGLFGCHQSFSICLAEIPSETVSSFSLSVCSTARPRPSRHWPGQSGCDGRYWFRSGHCHETPLTTHPFIHVRVYARSRPSCKESWVTESSPMDSRHEGHRPTESTALEILSLPPVAGLGLRARLDRRSWNATFSSPGNQIRAKSTVPCNSPWSPARLVPQRQSICSHHTNPWLTGDNGGW